MMRGKLRPAYWREWILSDNGTLLLLALALFLMHMFTNQRYGFHRDELAMLDNARHLDWGFVDYPPFTAFVVRIAYELFGPSLTGLRLFSALAQSTAMLLAGLMARAMGGSRPAQIVAALATAIAPIALALGASFMYVSFDYLWWVVAAYCLARLLQTENPRWWLGVGAAIGLGMMTKYTMAFFAAGIVGGVLLTPARRYLKSPWLWGSAALSLLIFLPNLIWQAQHDFISLDFLSSIHARDIRIGRADGYLVEQLVFCANPGTISLWLAGLYFYFFAPQGRRFRPLGWTYLIPFVIFLITRGRSYYLAPAYPVLLAGGSVAGEKWLSGLSPRKRSSTLDTAWWTLAIGGIFSAALALPIAPVNSAVWKVTSQLHDTFTEQIGWPELVETVGGIYAALPADEQTHTGILTGNYGEAGAINLYGPAYHLPEAISGINTYWLRGYGDPPPQTVIVLGMPLYYATDYFETCKVAGHVTNRYGVKNEETRDHPTILVCRGPRQPWPDFWARLKSFG
jgi:4-amino-4-deoxy-L-arabinose transferase-like glycosyltransferase